MNEPCPKFKHSHLRRDRNQSTIKRTNAFETLAWIENRYGLLLQKPKFEASKIHYNSKFDTPKGSKIKYSVPTFEKAGIKVPGESDH